ncbi:MAG: recombinase family protein [Bacteroidetes bacterium]|nr:recombinase family protein [Bacteroidota bacterium]
MSSNKIGILLRVSSDVQQTDGGGLEVQRSMGLEMSQKLGLKPVIFNEGSQSSFQIELEERIVLVELLDEISKGNIQNIWVYNSDRLGRSTQSWWSIYKVLLDGGVKVYIGSSTKPYDLDNPIDEFQMGILSLVSQYDNKLRRMRSVMGKRNSLKKGQTFVGGTIPFGYDVVSKQLVPNDGEVRVLNKVFQMYNEGKSTIEIKLYLDTKTEFLPKRSKEGWNLGTIQKMLGNSLYRGVQKWEWKEMVSGKPKIVETISLKTPQVVSSKLWDEVQVKLKENQKYRNVEKTIDTLLDGLIYCKSCGVKLSVKGGESRVNHLYSCRSVEYKWKNPGKWSKKHQLCSLKRSLRVNETDSLLLNHIIEIIKESKKIREDYKIKNLNPKFEEVKSVKRELDKRTKYLNEKRKIFKGYESNIIDLEVQILTNQMERGKGKLMIEKISELMNEVNSEIKRLESEMWIYENTTQWVDWLNKMYLEIDKVTTLPLEKRKNFLKEYLERVYVEYLESEQSHKFEFEFKYPIINDTMSQEGVDSSGRRVYRIEGGTSRTSMKIGFENTYKPKQSSDLRERLNKRISELRVEHSFSLSKVSTVLNNEGFRTSTKKEWNKSNLSIYIKRMGFDLGK